MIVHRCSDDSRVEIGRIQKEKRVKVLEREVVSSPRERVLEKEGFHRMVSSFEEEP